MVRGHQEEPERREPHEQDDLPGLVQREGARLRDGAGEGVEEETSRAGGQAKSKEGSYGYYLCWICTNLDGKVVTFEPMMQL